MSVTPADDDGDFSWRSEAYAWAVVGLLTLSMTLSMMDRMILSLLAQPLKLDLGLTDVQISLLHGLAFTLLYVTAGLPLGRLADRHSRRAIAGLSVIGWSVATSVCGLAGNFGQLFAARIGVGVGEAGLSPAANSLISDYFPKERLSKPIAFYAVGAAAGGGLALVIGGVVLNYLETLGQVTLPILGDVKPWQMAFFLVGLPGVLVGALFLFVREPVRRGRTIAADAKNSIGDTVAFLRGHASFFVPHFFGAAMMALTSGTKSAWMPTLLVRNFGITPGEAGVRYGFTMLVCGVIGLLVGGWVADALAARKRAGSHILVCIIGSSLAWLPAVFAPLVGNIWLAIFLAGTSVLVGGATVALAPVSIQVVTPNQMRGQIYAVYLFTISILAYTLGPLMVALLTDYVFKDEALLRYSLATIVAISTPLSVLGFWLSRRQFVRLTAP